MNFPSRLNPAKSNPDIVQRTLPQHEIAPSFNINDDGWENQHLHVFHIWGVDYGIAYEGGAYYRDDPSEIFIGDLGLSAGDKFHMFMILAITGNTKSVSKRLRISGPDTNIQFVQPEEGHALRKIPVGLMPIRML